MQRPRLRLSSPLIRHVTQALDVLIIWVCGWGVYQWHVATNDGTAPALRYELLVLAGSLLLMGFSGRLYRSWRVNQLGAMVHAVVVAWGGTAMLLLAWLFATKSSSDVSRLWFTVWFGSVLMCMSLLRLVVYAGLRWLRTQGYNYKTVLLVGKGPASRQVDEALKQSAWSGMRVVAHVMPHELATHVARLEADKVLIDEVWLCLALGNSDGIHMAMEALRNSTANIRLVPDWSAVQLLNPGVTEVVGIQMLDLSASPMTTSMHLLKAGQDFVLASLILLLISPLMLLIAAAVKLTSPGPVFYQQKRHGWNGEEIWVYKFRSMVVHQEDGHQVTQARKRDARITPLGAFLRRTSLDELPQFLNVLQGRMSIVGPRPHAMAHNEHYKDLVPGYAKRHKVKPGITGWAQVNGFRGETDTLDKMEKRVEYDLFYVEHMSLWLDLKIIAATVFKGFIHKNAY